MANTSKAIHGTNCSIVVYVWDGSLKNQIPLGAALSYRCTGTHQQSNGLHTVNVVETDRNHPVATLSIKKGTDIKTAIKRLLAGDRVAWFDVSCKRIPA